MRIKWSGYFEVFTVVFLVPLTNLREESERGGNGLERRNPRSCLVRGVLYPSENSYYRGCRETRPESPYQYYRRDVGSTEGPVGSTDIELALPLILQNSKQ
jgi:hypothetical protein